MVLKMPDKKMSTEEWLEYKGCKTKRPYSTKATAKKAAKDCKTIGMSLRPYKCDYCDSWHLCDKRKQ